MEGVLSPAYKTIFKSDHHRLKIQAVWAAILSYSSTARTGRVPSYTCIKPGDTSWNLCLSGSYTVSPVSELSVVGICPNAFGLAPGRPSDYRSENCPTVRYNQFSARPGGGGYFVNSLAQLISDALIDKYAAIPITRDDTLFTRLNSAVARGIDSSSLFSTNYQMYIRRK